MDENSRNREDISKEGSSTVEGGVEALKIAHFCGLDSDGIQAVVEAIEDLDKAIAGLKPNTPTIMSLNEQAPELSVERALEIGMDGYWRVKGGASLCRVTRLPFTSCPSDHQHFVLVPTREEFTAALCEERAFIAEQAATIAERDAELRATRKAACEASRRPPCSTRGT